MPFPARLPFTGAAVACLLAACGGGGGGTSPTAATTVPLEGFYQGSTSGKETLQALVLENGDFWGVVIPATNTSGAPSALLQGSGNSSAALVQNNSLYTVPSVLQINNGQVATTGSITASYVPRVSMQGTLALSSGTNSTFSESALATSSYNYDLPANVATLAGTWAGIAFDGSSATLAVDGSTGAFSIPGGGNCTLSGTITARASGKNVYDVSASYATTPTDNTVPGITCTRAGLSAKGFALSFGISGAKQQVVLATLDADRKLASYFTASR